jgi:hypothetical protein
VKIRNVINCNACHDNTHPGDWRMVHPSVVKKEGSLDCFHCHDALNCYNCHTTNNVSVNLTSR